MSMIAAHKFQQLQQNPQPKSRQHLKGAAPKQPSFPSVTQSDNTKGFSKHSPSHGLCTRASIATQTGKLPCQS
jgi:hypothetical protein